MGRERVSEEKCVVKLFSSSWCLCGATHREREQGRAAVFFVVSRVECGWDKREDGECDAFGSRANRCTRVNLVVRAMPGDGLAFASSDGKCARANDHDREDSCAQVEQCEHAR